MNAFESVQRGHVLERRVGLAGLITREVGVLVGAGGGAMKDEAPVVRATVAKAQRLERYLDEDHVTVLGHFGPVVPESVPGEREVLSVGNGTVLLNPFGIDVEEIGVLLVGEGVEEEADLVVVVHVFTA